VVGGDSRDNLSASLSVGRAKLLSWRILELELPVEGGSSIVTRAHGCAPDLLPKKSSKICAKSNRIGGSYSD